MARASDLRSVSRKVSTGAAARRRRNYLFRFLPLAVLALGAVGTPWLLLSTGRLAQIERLKDEKKSVDLEISRLNKRIEYLQARAVALKTDPVAVERAARDQMGLVRRTEVVYHFRDFHE